MGQADTAKFISDDLRLRAFPVGVKFLKDKSTFPEKTRQPSTALGKRITICQAVTMARLYGWTMGLTKEDLICVPAMIAFGFTSASDRISTLGKLFCDVSFSQDEVAARTEAGSINFLENQQYPAIVLAPLHRALFEPDAIVFYGNPAQVTRMIEATVYRNGKRISGNFGSKAECTEYLIAPFITGVPRVAIPDNGDRAFSMTQDDELVFAIPGRDLESLAEGLRAAGKKVGHRYPVTFYQNFQPEFPKPFKDLGESLGAF
jgi:uncharacterized protein (DUF169 family)